MHHTLTIIPLLLLYCAMQTVATILTKYGAMSPRHKVLMFLLANILNVASVGAVMLMYRHLSGNIVIALAVGSAFLCGQTALALFFRQPLRPIQYLGIAIVLAGIIAVSW